MHVISTQSGAYIRTWGRAGKGPGEFTNNGNVQLVGDSLLVFTVASTRRVMTFAVDGTLRDEQQFEKLSVLRVVRDAQGRSHALTRADSANSTLMQIVSPDQERASITYLPVEWHDDPDERDFRNAYRVHAAAVGGVWTANRFSGPSVDSAPRALHKARVSSRSPSPRTPRERSSTGPTMIPTCSASGACR